MPITRAGGGGPFGGFGRARAPQKGADIAYRLKVSFVDAANLKEQRITLAGGRTIDLKLPKGVEDGTKIRLAGQGQQGPGGKGDAIVTVEVAPHPHFSRDGKDIRLSLPVTLKEAVEGAKVRAPTPEGPVMLTVPKGSTSGKVLRLKGRGFTDKAGKRGDLLVTLAVDLPAGDAALEKFVAGWDGGGNPRAGMDSKCRNSTHCRPKNGASGSPPRPPPLARIASTRRVACASMRRSRSGDRRELARRRAAMALSSSAKGGLKGRAALKF